MGGGKPSGKKPSRRGFLGTVAAGLALGGGASWYYRGPYESGMRAAVFIGRADSYAADLRRVIRDALQELGIGAPQFRGRSVLLKPNLVEPSREHAHINTHPAVVQAAAAVMLEMGAGRVVVGEGAGHVRDALLVLEESGFAEVLREDRLPFADFNLDDLHWAPNRGRFTTLERLAFPKTLFAADVVVSMPKLKTHHWAGVTLSMKNLFGLMPGSVYGWPKNVLHQEGIPGSIVDISASAPVHLAIVDGIVGMEGDGPIMGTPKHAGVIVAGTNLAAVDATCARIMGLEPERIPYLSLASGWLGPIREEHIEQRGERPASVRQDFALIDAIPAHRGLRLREPT